MQAAVYEAALDPGQLLFVLCGPQMRFAFGPEATGLSTR